MRLVCKVFLDNKKIRKSWLCDKCGNKIQEEMNVKNN